MRRDVPHIEGRKEKRGKWEKRERKRKPQKKKFPAGRKSVRKAKERQRHITRQWKNSVPRGRGSYLYHPREARCKKRSEGECKEGGRGGEERDHIFAADHDSFNIKLGRVMQLLLAVFTGEPRKTRKISTSRGDRIFFGACPKSDKMSVVSTSREKRSRLYHLAKSAEYICGIYRGIYLVVILYKYNEKILL